MTETDYANVYTRFACMRSRGGVIGFSASGVRVDAATPEELTEATDRALIQVTEAQDPS
jgi:hypothetical protein